MTACVVWITGLPSAGKSTFAQALAAELRAAGEAVAVLDGDAVRACLVPEVGYAPHERANFYETLARLAALLAGQGLTVIVPATANRRAFREHARALAPSFIEVWLDTPLAVCRERDAKQLYAKSHAGAAAHVPGAGEEYEPPRSPEIIAHDGGDRDALARTRALLRERCSRDPRP